MSISTASQFSWPKLNQQYRFLVLGLIYLGHTLAPTHSKHLPSFAGPFIADVQRITACPSSEWDTAGGFMCHVRLSHYNPGKPRDLQIITGNMTLPQDFTDTAWIRINMASRSNNQWKDNAFHFNFPRTGCSSFRTQLPNGMKVIFKINPYTKEPCLIPKGTYVFNDPMNWTFPKFPVMPYGHYRWMLKTGLQGSTVVLQCLTVEFHILPSL